MPPSSLSLSVAHAFFSLATAIQRHEVIIAAPLPALAVLIGGISPYLLFWILRLRSKKELQSKSQ